MFLTVNEYEAQLKINYYISLIKKKRKLLKNLITEGLVQIKSSSPITAGKNGLKNLLCVRNELF